jgi:Fur family transcriptional regulator, ferric uptake regulator
MSLGDQPGVYADLATISIWHDTADVDPDADLARLRSLDMMATAPRRHVLSALRCQSAPASASEVYDDLRAADVRIALTTVYRTLQLFARRGLVHSFPGTEQRYRLCALTPHAHLICEGCQTVFEQPVPALMRWLSGAGRQDFEIDLQHTTVYGMCGACRSATARLVSLTDVAAGCPVDSSIASAS